MKERALLSQSNPKFNPYYRSKWYNFETRCKLRYTNRALWYSDQRVGDPYKQDWKRRVNRKGANKSPHHTENQIKLKMTNVTTVMFVPSTVDGGLINKLENLEQKLYSEKAFDWNVKLVEKSGTPLTVLFYQENACCRWVPPKCKSHRKSSYCMYCL